MQGVGCEDKTIDVTALCLMMLLYSSYRRAMGTQARLLPPGRTSVLLSSQAGSVKCYVLVFIFVNVTKLYHIACFAVVYFN